MNKLQELGFVKKQVEIYRIITILEISESEGGISSAKYNKNNVAIVR